MRFLVTGSNGLVGSRLARMLGEKGHDVVGTSLGPRLPAADGNYVYAECDLINDKAVEALVAVSKPEVIINTAAMTDVDGCETNPKLAHDVNSGAVASLARQARQVGAHLVQVSTDYVYDGDHGPYTEESIPNPRGNYAITKFMGELAARTFLPNATIARTAVVYGWPQAEKSNFGSWVVSTLAAGKRCTLFEDQFVSPSLADNVAEMLAELGEKKLPGIFHTAGADIMDRVTFGRAVCERFGFDPKLVVPTRLKDAKLKSPRPYHSGLKVDKVKSQLAAKPLSLAEALERLHAAWRQK